MKKENKNNLSEEIRLAEEKSKQIRKQMLDVEEKKVWTKKEINELTLEIDRISILIRNVDKQIEKYKSQPNITNVGLARYQNKIKKNSADLAIFKNRLNNVVAEGEKWDELSLTLERNFKDFDILVKDLLQRIDKEIKKSKRKDLILNVLSILSFFVSIYTVVYGISKISENLSTNSPVLTILYTIYTIFGFLGIFFYGVGLKLNRKKREILSYAKIQKIESDFFSVINDDITNLLKE